MDIAVMLWLACGLIVLVWTERLGVRHEPFEAFVLCFAGPLPIFFVLAQIVIGAYENWRSGQPLWR